MLATRQQLLSQVDEPGFYAAWQDRSCEVAIELSEACSSRSATRKSETLISVISFQIIAAEERLEDATKENCLSLNSLLGFVSVMPNQKRCQHHPVRHLPVEVSEEFALRWTKRRARELHLLHLHLQMIPENEC